MDCHRRMDPFEIGSNIDDQDLPFLVTMRTHGFKGINAIMRTS